MPKTQIIEAALASFLSPDSAEQSEGAAIVRRLDPLTRSIERLERDHEITIRGAGAVRPLLADDDSTLAG